MLSLTGDFSGNGVVDAADYVALSKNGGAAQDFQAWRSHFGNDQSMLPGAFQITGPGHELTNDHFTITWETSPGATSYRLSVSNAVDGSNPHFTAIVATTSKSLTNQGEGSVYVTLSALNEAGETTASNQVYWITIDLPSSKQVLFVSSLEYFIDPFEFYPPFSNEFGSDAAADYQATNKASQAGLLAQPWDGSTIHFRAFLTVTLVSAQYRANVINVPIENTLGQVIANDVADLLDGTLNAPILDEHGNSITSGNLNIWTGANADGTWSGFTADDWSNTNGTATVGKLNGAGTSWLSFGTRSGSLSARIYCIGIQQVPFNSPALVEQTTVTASSMTATDSSRLAVIDLPIFVTAGIALTDDRRRSVESQTVSRNGTASTFAADSSLLLADSSRPNPTVQQLARDEYFENDIESDTVFTAPGSEWSLANSWDQLLTSVTA